MELGPLGPHGVNVLQRAMVEIVDGKGSAQIPLLLTGARIVPLWGTWLKQNPAIPNHA